MFGTFDIANFGDILFPIVAEAMFHRIDPSIELVRYSYRPKAAADWHYEVRPIERFAEDLPGTDLVLVGGGHLIHANAFMAPGYRPLDRSIPHPFGFWWLPALAGRMAGVPVALHAPSVEPAIPEWARPLFEAFAQSADYVSARDAESVATLKSLGARDVALVPDTIFSVSRLIERGRASDGFARFRSAHGLTGPYLIVQPSAALRRQRGEMDRLIAEAHAKGWRVLELPIFQEKLNRAGLFTNVPGVIVARQDPDPLLLAEIIANAHGVVGVSLHLSIVAATFGVPVYRKSYEPTSKFVLLDEVPGIRFLGQGARLDDAADTPAAIIADYQARLDRHYERLVALAAEAHGRDRRARGWEMLKRLPEALRRRQAIGDRAREARQRATRIKNFTAARFATPIDRALAVFRR